MFVFLVSSQRNRRGYPTPSSACFPHRLIVYKVIDTFLQNSACQRNTYRHKWHFFILLQMKQILYNICICLQNFASQGNSYQDLTQTAYPHLTEEAKINKPHTSSDQILLSLSKILTEYYAHII